jgi:hypothetical protein
MLPASYRLNNNKLLSVLNMLHKTLKSLKNKGIIFMKQFVTYDCLPYETDIY